MARPPPPRTRRTYPPSRPPAEPGPCRWGRGSRPPPPLAHSSPSTPARSTRRATRWEAGGGACWLSRQARRCCPVQEGEQRGGREADAWGLSSSAAARKPGRDGVARAMAGPNAPRLPLEYREVATPPWTRADYVHMQSPMGVGGGGTGSGSSTGRAKVAPVTGDQMGTLHAASSDGCSAHALSGSGLGVCLELAISLSTDVRALLFWERFFLLYFRQRDVAPGYMLTPEAMRATREDALVTHLASMAPPRPRPSRAMPAPCYDGSCHHPPARRLPHSPTCNGCNGRRSPRRGPPHARPPRHSPPLLPLAAGRKGRGGWHRVLSRRTRDLTGQVRRLVVGGRRVWGCGPRPPHGADGGGGRGDSRRGGGSGRRRRTRGRGPTLRR